jgi:hypothetical protein
MREEPKKNMLFGGVWSLLSRVRSVCDVAFFVEDQLMSVLMSVLML